MKKILLCIFCIFLVSCGTKNTENPENTPSQTENIATGATTISRENFDETLKNASKKITETDEFNACLAPQVSMCINTTASDIAQKTGNLEICGELSDEMSRSGCQLGVMMSKIYTHKDDFRSPEKCDIIENTDIKNVCKTQIITLSLYDTLDISGCQAVADLYTDTTEQTRAKDNCIATIATKTKKVENCATISDEFEKKSCISIIESQLQYENQSSTGAITR